MEAFAIDNLHKPQNADKMEYTFSTKEFLPGASFDKTDKEKSFRNVLGFHAKGFFDKIVDIQKCWLQPEPTNELVMRYSFSACELLVWKNDLGPILN